MGGCGPLDTPFWPVTQALGGLRVWPASVPRPSCASSPATWSSSPCWPRPPGTRSRRSSSAVRRHMGGGTHPVVGAPSLPPRHTSAAEHPGPLAPSAALFSPRFPGATPRPRFHGVWTWLTNGHCEYLTLSLTPSGLVHPYSYLVFFDDCAHQSASPHPLTGQALMKGTDGPFFLSGAVILDVLGETDSMYRGPSFFDFKKQEKCVAHPSSL